MPYALELRVASKPKTVTADFVTQIAEKQSKQGVLVAEIASIIVNIDTLKADLKKAEKEVSILEAKKTKKDAKIAEEAKKAEAESVFKKLLADEITENP